MKRLIGWLVAVAILCAGSSSAADKLAWQFRAKEKLVATIEQEIVGKAMLDAKEVLTGTRAVVRLNWETEKVEAGGQAAVSLKFDRILVVFLGAGQKAVRFDSADKEHAAEAKEVAAALAPLVGAELKIRVQPSGKIAAVEVPAETQKLLRRAAVSGRLKPLFSAEGIERLLRQALPRLPEIEVAAGATWDDEVRAETALGSTKTTYRSTYRGEMGADKLRQWTIEPSVSFADGSLKHTGKLALEGEVVDATTTIGAQTGSGKAAFHPQTGRVVFMEMRHEMTLETKLPSTSTKQQVTTTTKAKIEEGK